MQLTPYLMFNGECEEALNFYVKAFKGEIRNIVRFEGSQVESMASEKDKKRIMHSHFVAKDFMFMASDTAIDGPTLNKNGLVHMCINFEERDEQERVFSALAVDGAAGMPIQDTFWGAKFGMVTDKFGICWMLNYEEKKDNEK